MCVCFSIDVRRWQDYVEPGDELETVQLRRTSRHVDGDDEGIDHLLPLPEGVLTRNLGLDIVVVVTKVLLFVFAIDRNFHFETILFFPQSDGLHGDS